MSTSGKKSQGRRKIEMKKITNESHLSVTFSKRRYGLFKKASELNTLCGTKMAIIVFSPSGNVFSFGHPNVEVVIERYLSRAMPQPSENILCLEALRSTKLRELNNQLSIINNELDACKKHEKELNCMLKEAQTQISWTCQIEDMDMHHLKQFKVVLEKLKKMVNCFLNETATTASYTAGPSNSVIPLHHQPPPSPHVFSPHFFQGSSMQSHELFSWFNVGGYGGPHDVGATSGCYTVGPSNGMIPLLQPPPPIAPQVFPSQLFQDPMMQRHQLFGGLNMEVYARRPDDGTATANARAGSYDGMIHMQHPQPPPLNVFQPLLFQGPMMQSHQFFAGFNMGGNGGPSDDGATISSAAIGPSDGIIPLNCTPPPSPPQMVGPDFFQAP